MTTYALGTTYCVALYCALLIRPQIVFDEQGNVGYARTGTLGLGTPAASMGGAFTMTNAETIYDLEGLSGQMGGSISMVGLDVFGSDVGGINEVVGCTIELSPVSGTIFAAEGHIEAALTDIVPIHESDYVERAYEEFASFVKRTVGSGTIGYAENTVVNKSVLQDGKVEWFKDYRNIGRMTECGLK